MNHHSSDVSGLKKTCELNRKSDEFGLMVSTEAFWWNIL